MAGDKFDQLYNALKADGAVSGTREHFRQFVYAPGKQGYHNRKQLYDALHADGAVSSKSYEEFAQRLGLHAVNPKPQQQKPLTMKQRAQEVAAQYQKPRQQKAQQPRTATASGTDYMKNWKLMHMRNDQMNPMQQAQASNARARMQRAQEQAARQEQQRATPISRSRITPTAKNFNETMQQLSTPEARQARAKQQREDDARTLAQYEVEGNKFVRNDGQSEGILGNDLLKLVDSSMNEAQELTRQQYQQNLDKNGGIYAPQSVKEQAFRDAQAQEQVNRQNVLMNNLSSKINEIYSQKGMQRHIAESAEKLNMGVEEYVDKYVTPEIVNYAQKALTMRNQEEIMPHGALDYIAKNLSNSIIGMVLAPSVMSRDTRQRLQEGIAIADGDAEIQKVDGHKDETYRSGIGTRFASTAVNMAADSGPLAVIGAGASAAVNTGTRVLTNGLVKAGVMEAAQKLTAQQMAFKVANMTTAQKIMSGLGTRTATSSLNLAGYSGVTAALSQASTGDDTSLQAIAEAGLKGAGHGAVTGAMFGVSGAVMSPWVSKFGITGMEKSTGERLLHGTQKFGATAAGLGVEAGTMMVADNVTGDKDISFGTWLEDVVMVGAFKAGEPSNFVKMGNILHHLTHNSGGNFVIGKNANGSPIAVDIRLTPDEKNELISSASGKNLMDAFVKVDRASKTAPRDPKYKTAYTDFMNDSDVSQSTKEKVNAAMGLFNTTRGKSYRSVNDVKNKQILEYTKNGTLLTRTSYKNADERRAILYKQKLYRDNDDMLSLIGYSKMKDMQLTDEDGNVTSLVLGFLRDNGYDTSKDVTDPKNAQLINDLRNPKSALYLDWEKYVDKNGSYGYIKSGNTEVVGGFLNAMKEIINDKGQMIVDIDKIMQKDPMKRTDQENQIFYGVKRALEYDLFPSGRPHEDQSASQGKAAAEDNNLGTEQPNGEVVLDELRNLRNAEQELEAAMEGNDVFKQVFEKLHQQGLTPAQIYDALIQNGLTQEELTPLAQYINANARAQGMQQATADAIEENVKEFTSDWSYHGTLNGQKMDGEQALYVQDSNSRTLLVGSGDVSFDPITGKAKEGSGDMLVCLDPNTKEMVYVKADEVTLFQNQPIDQFAAEYRQRLQMKNSEPYNQAAQEQAMQDAAKAQQEQEAANISENTVAEPRPQNEPKNEVSSENQDVKGGREPGVEEPRPQPQPTRKFADGTDVPMATDSKGRPTPDYASMTPEQSAEILTEDFGENAEKVVDGQIKKAENALKDAEKMKVDYTAEPNDIIEQEALKNQTIEAAKKQLDHAQNIKKAMTAKKVAETVGSTEQTEGAHEAGSVAAQKFVNAPRLVGNKRTRMLPDGETKIKGHYEIVPAESLTPSHDVNNGYKKSEGFPTDAEGRTVNGRDYEHDKAAQQNTDQIARKYNGMAIEQVPVVSDEGIVYDGNGRTMAGQKAAKDGTDGEYINDLLENAENFGFTREQIEQSGIEHPRLVLVTDERLPYDAATFAKFNRNEKKTQSNTEQAVAKSKTLTSDEIGAIVAEIDGNGSLDAFFNNSKAINDLIKTLVSKGIIGQNEVAQMMESPERLSAQGREFVKNLLLGSIFKPETIRMLGIDSTVKNKAINAIRSVMDNMKLGEFSLRDEIDQAIQLLYEARQGGNKVDTLLRTSDMYGEDAAKRYSSISQMMALALEGKVSDFRDLLDEYNRIAAARNTGEGSIFEAAPTKEELVKEFLDFKKWQDYGTGHSEIEGSNDVSGDEKPQQEASGGNEPAEAERPRVEEPDDLVNKELESRIEVTDEETETPSKNGPIMKQKILIDGDKEVMKVDEPNKKGEYTGSYYEYDGKKFGDLNEVTEYIDSKKEEGPLPLLPNEEKPDPKFNPIEAAAAEFKKEHPLTEDEIMGIKDLDDEAKYTAIDYLNGEDDSEIARICYEQAYNKAKGKKQPKVEEPKTEKPISVENDSTKSAKEKLEKAVDYINDQYDYDFKDADTLIKWALKKGGEKFLRKWISDNLGPLTNEFMSSYKTVYQTGKSAAEQVKTTPKTAEQKKMDIKKFKEESDKEIADLMNQFLAAANDRKDDGGGKVLSTLLPIPSKALKWMDRHLSLTDKQKEILPKLLSAMKKGMYARIKEGVYNLEDVMERVRKDFDFFFSKIDKEDANKILAEAAYKGRYTDPETGERMKLSEFAEREKKNTPEHQENLVGDSKSAEERKQAEKKFIDAVNLQLGFKHKFNGIVELRKIAERVGLKDIKDTDLQELAETAIVKRARGIASSESTNDAVKFERIKTLYENQPSLNQRDSERVMKQQYSTPAPYAFLADMYVKGNGKVIESALEPSAGNGMLTIGLPMDKVHVNDIDAQRLANLRRQGFKNVTSQDGTQPFADKNVDVVVTNPPFGSATPKEYDGYKISSLEGQMAINALESMKDDGRAAIIIGGKTEYAKNGSLNPKDKAFLGYLYSHYNVEDVINVDGSLYAKQGTSYPTRIILINGRRLDENAFPPVKDKARAETVKDYDELYKRIEDDILRGERMDSSIGEEGGKVNAEPDKQGAADTPKERVRARERGGSEPDGKRGSDVSDTSSVSGTHDDLDNQRGTDPRKDGELPDGDSRTDGTGAEPTPSKEPTTGANDGRVSGSGGAGGNDTQPSSDEPASTGSGSGPRGQLQRVDKSVRGLSTEKVAYAPKSGNPFTLKAVMPADQQEAVNKNLEKLGDADQFLVDELGYNDKDDLYSHLAAEQVDSVALALLQAKKGNAFIIGDMTGIGKGRQAASLIRYAKKQGQVPVYFTKTAGLLSDVYRDLVDIGSPDLRPFVFGSAKEAAITDSEGNVVFDLPSKSEVKRVLDYIEKNGKLPDEYDYVLTTYSQVSNGVYEFDEDGNRKERKLAKGKSFGAAALSGQKRRDAIEKLMYNAYLILDESHTAGGNSGQGNYFQHIIQKAKNVTFFSATFAKRPDNMPIYALRTAMNEGGMKASDLIDAVKRGGATLQEIMSQTLTQCGQMIRRERDMTGVTIDWKAIDDPERVQEQREQYDSIIGLFNDIINFQKKYVSSYVDERNIELADIQSTMDIKKGTESLGIKNQPFASKAFNTVQQVLLSLKAKSAAERAIYYLKQGMKPVIALNNTNESQTGNLALGEEMDAPDLGTSLKKGLEGTLRYTKKDAKDNTESGYFKLEDLGEEAVEAYHELEKKIEQTSTGLSLSPIDVIKNELQKAGYKVGELTGRQTEFVYNENGTVTKVKRADTDKKKLAREFNDGQIDALILNKSAATGISLHASSKYKDQRKRVMIVAQQQLDVNDEVQMRGRIDRTGQVLRGAYEYVVSLIPAEQRLLMMFKAKLKSLDANTTSSQKSKFNEMDVADITNKYGDKVVREYMAEHLDLYSRMADPFGWEESYGDGLVDVDKLASMTKNNEPGADASKLLGRMALLKVSEQEKMLQEIGELYANEIQRLNDMGENDLEITELPLKAKTIRKEVWRQGTEPGGDNAFADNTYIEKVNMAILKKPMKAEEVEKAQNSLTGGKSWDEYKQAKKDEIKSYFDSKAEADKKRYEERAVKIATKAREKYLKDAKKGQEKSGMSDDQIKQMADYQYDNIYKQEKEKGDISLATNKSLIDNFYRVLDTFTTEDVYVLPLDMNKPNELSGFGNSYGRLVDIKIADNYSIRSSVVTFATLDGRRKITFPVSGDVGSGENRADIIASIDRLTKQASGLGDKQLRVLNMDIKNWDKLVSNESRKDGYIVTGNLMQALVDSKDQGLGGQLVKYTADTGEVKTGILMPDRFDPKGLTTDAPINSVAQKFELSSWHGGIDEVTSSDGEVKVKRIDNYRGNYYELRVPKSKAKGGKYFTDKELLEMVDGHNFETRGNSMLAEFKPDQLKPVLDRLSKMGVKVQEERKTSEDEGTHFREDRGLRYSKTDTKDVKKGRIIPEDVDKDVSSQIEKKFDDEIERVYGSNITPEERAEIEKATTIFSRTAYSDEWYKDENKVKHVRKGLSSWHNYYNDLAKQFEEAYGITRKTRITTSKTAENNTRDGLVGMPDLSTSRSGNEEAGIGRGDERRMPEEDAKYYRKIIESLAAINRAHDYFVERAEKLASKYGVRGDEWIPNEVIEKVFEDYNSDKNIKKLYELVKEQIKNLDVKFADVYGGENGTVGYYDHGWNSIRINFEELCAHGSTNQDLASTILHEMLHPLTSDIIAMYQKGYADKLTPSQIDAAKEAIDIYNELKQMQKDGKLSNHYGLTNPREMITELATPKWRKALSEIPNGKHWWSRIINTVAKFFGVNKFNKLGELTDTLDKLLSNFGKEQFDFASRHQKELFDEENQGKKVTDPEEIKRLEEEPKIKVYRAMQVIDGKLYPPMAASVGGKLVEANELGQWIRADENPDLAIPDIDPKTGKQKVDKKTGELKWKFKLDKGGRDATGKKATDINAAYNPYWHMSRSPLNDQFKSAWIRPNIVVVECETPVSELTSGYKAERAKDAVGEVDWKSGSVSGEVFKQTGRARKVILSRWCKPVRVLDDAEVAQKAKEFIGDAKVEIPENVLTPKQRIAFEEAGFKIGAPEKGVKKSEQIMEALEKGLTIDNTVFSEDGTKFRTDHGDGNYPASSVESHVEKVAQKTGGKVQMVSSVDEITNKAARAAIEDGRKITGWYDEKTGEVHLYMPNIHDRYTAEKTIWHEVVGHKGMRELFGDERFDKFLRDVWYDLDKHENADLRKLVDEERKYNPLNIYDAIEEGIARLAEDGKGEPGFWNGIKNKVSDFLHEIGYRIAPNTKDVKYLLWLSKNLQKNQNDPYWKMRAEAVKYRLDHDRMPAVVAHDGMFYGNDGKVRSMDNLTKAEWNEATDGEIHFRTTPSAGTALDRYHRSLDEHGYMFTESYMDNMLSLKKLMNAIVPDKKIEDIASSENPYMLQNTMQGAMSDAAQMFERNVMKPLDKAMADVLDAFDGKKDDEKIRNFNLYMITKHGLERNRVFFVRDFLKKMRRDEKKKQDADFLENSYYSDKEHLDNELKAGNIDLKEYYRQLDESIRNHFEADFEAGEHDYSGLHAIQEVAKSSDPYDDAEAIQSVMDSEAKMEGIKKGAVKNYWDKVKAATQYSIDSDYKNGIISSELYGHVSNMFNWYVPLRKYDEATAEDVYGYITEVGDPKSYIGSTIMRARGHKYLSETNVLAQIGAMGNRAIKNGGMNAIRQAFARFARNNSNNNLITETSVWYEKDPMTGIVYERYPDIPEDATADEINQIVSDFNKDMKAKALQNLASKVYRRGSIGYKFQRAENKSQHIVDVKIAGRTHAFIINGNPRAAQALNGLLENSGAKGIMKPLSSISRMMAQLCTSYNPEFVMRNIMRDAEFASSNVTSKEGARYGALWAKYYAQLGLYKGASNISLKDFSGSTGLGLFAKYRNGTLDMSNKVERYFKEFMENGGETGWVQIKNMKDWTKEYKKDVSTERSKLGKGGAALRDFFFGNLENVNEVAENIARFATYCTSRDSNRSIIRSVYDAKEVSTNFNRHGSGDAISSFKNGEMTGAKAAERWVYGFTASYLRHCSMFFNAGIQSTNLLVKNLKNHPVGTSINMLAIPFALGALAALGNNVLIASEDEKDRKGVKDPYGELPDYVRRNNLCIYKGKGEFVTIPLAIELRAFYGLGDLAAGLTFSPNVSGQKNPYFDAVGCMSQLVPVMDYLGNSSAGKEPLNETIKAIAPSALSPFVEWELNTDWKGAPIERRGDWNEDVPAWQRAYKGTPDGYMALNKFVNAQTNEVAKGNEDMLGNSFLDMVTNPSMLNHYIGGLGGGAATFTERAIGVVKHGKDTETKDIPFLRSLLYTPSEQSSLQRTKSKWYNYKDEMEKMIANVDRLKSKNVPIEKRISNYSDYYRFQNSKDAAKVRVIELAEKQMKQWKKLRDKSSDTESINFANQNIDRIMMEAVDDLDKLN
jgi:hypothetical protein